MSRTSITALSNGASLLSALSPVHTSDNVAKNGVIVAETGDNVAETGNIVFLATMLPDCCRFRRQCRLCGRHYGDNVAGFGDIVADIVAATIDLFSLRKLVP